MQSLIEHFVVCGLNPEALITVKGESGFSSATARYNACLLDSLPHEDISKGNLPHHLPLCCLPAGVDLVPVQDAERLNRNPSCYSVVLTEGNRDATKLYVSCLSFYDQIPSELRAQYRDLHAFKALKCICILSHYAYLQTFTKVLRAVYKLCFQEGCPGSLFHTINYLLSVPCPSTMGKSVMFPLAGQLFLTEPIDQHGVPPNELSLQPLVQALDPDGLLALFMAVLVERRVLLRASQYWLLTAVTEGLCQLLYPLKFPHVYIPVMPHSLVDYIEMPTIFLMGLDSSVVLPEELSLDGIVLVDLDRSHSSNHLHGNGDVVFFSIKTWTHTKNGDDDTFSKDLQRWLEHPAVRRLYNRLEFLLVPSTLQRDCADDGDWYQEVDPLRRRPWGSVHDEVLRNSFLQLFVDLLDGYHKFARPVGHARNAGEKWTSEFHVEEFVKSQGERNGAGYRPGREAGFLQQVVQTNMFYAFLEEHCHDPDPYNWAQAHLNPSAPDDKQLDVIVCPDPPRPIPATPKGCTHKVFPPLICLESDSSPSGANSPLRKLTKTKSFQADYDTLRTSLENQLRVSGDWQQLVSREDTERTLTLRGAAVDEVKPSGNSVRTPKLRHHARTLGLQVVHKAAKEGAVLAAQQQVSCAGLIKAQLASLRVLLEWKPEKGGRLEISDQLMTQTPTSCKEVISHLKHLVASSQSSRCILPRPVFRVMCELLSIMACTTAIAEDWGSTLDCLQLGLVFAQSVGGQLQPALTCMRTQPLLYSDWLWAASFAHALSELLSQPVWCEHATMKQLVLLQLVQFSRYMVGLGVMEADAWKLLTRLAHSYLRVSQVADAEFLGSLRAYVIHYSSLERMWIPDHTQLLQQDVQCLLPAPSGCVPLLGKEGLNSNTLLPLCDPRTVRVYPPAGGEIHQMHVAGGHIICTTPHGTTLYAMVGHKLDVIANYDNIRAKNCSCVHLSFDGAFLMMADNTTNEIYIGGTHNGLVTAALRGHSSPVTRILDSLYGATLLTGDTAGVLHVWRLAAAAQQHSLTPAATHRQHTACVTCIAEDNSGKWTATGDASGLVCIWTALGAGMKLVHRVQSGDTGVDALQLCSAHHKMVSKGRDHVIRIWSIKSGCCEAVLVNQTVSITCVYLHTPYILAGGADGSVAVWDLHGNLCASHHLHSGAVGVVDCFKGRVVSGALDNSAVVWGSQHRWASKRSCPIVSATQHIYRTSARFMQLDHKLNNLVSACANGTLCIWSCMNDAEGGS